MRRSTLLSTAALFVVAAGLGFATGDRRVRAQTSENSDSPISPSADGDISAHLVQVEMGRSEIRLDGEQIVDLSGGTLDRSRWAQAPWGPIVAPLKPAIRKRLDSSVTDPLVYPETLLLLPRPTTRFDILEGSAAAAYAAGLSRFRLGVEDPEHRELAIVAIDPPTADPADAPPLELEITWRGFELRLDGEAFRTRNDCPENGPAVCLEDRDADVEESIEEARAAVRSGDAERGRELLSDAFEAYDFEELQAVLVEFDEHRPENQTRYRLDAEPDLPAALVIATILRIKAGSIRSRGVFGPTRRGRTLLNEPEFGG